MLLSSTEIFVVCFFLHFLDFDIFLFTNFAKI